MDWIKIVISNSKKKKSHMYIYIFLKNKIFFVCKKKIEKIKKNKEISSTGSQPQKPPQFNSCWAQIEPNEMAIKLKFKFKFFI